MGNLDSRIAAALDSLVPPRQQPDRWGAMVASVPAPGLGRPRTARRKYLAVLIAIGACALLALPAYAVVDRIIAAFSGTAPKGLPLGGVQDLPAGPSPTIAASECTGDVRISFKWRAPPAQVAALELCLHRDAAVKSVRVITPAQSFAQLRAKYPDEARGLRWNPFSYIVDVWLERPGHARRFVDRYRATKIPGVEGRSMTIGVTTMRPARYLPADRSSRAIVVRRGSGVAARFWRFGAPGAIIVCALGFALPAIAAEVDPDAAAAAVVPCPPGPPGWPLGGDGWATRGGGVNGRFVMTPSTCLLAERD